MTERFLQSGEVQGVNEAPLQPAPIDAEPSLVDQFNTVRALYDQIAIADLIDKLTLLQQIEQQMPGMQERIQAVESGVEELDRMAVELDEEPKKIIAAIQAAESRISSANAALKVLRSQEEKLEDEIDELEGRVDDDSVRMCAARRASLKALRVQKENQRTVKQLQGRAIKELEAELATLQSDIQIEKTAHNFSDAQYKEGEILTRRRLDYLVSELGRVANAQTVIVSSVENIVHLPELTELPPLPGRLNSGDTAGESAPFIADDYQVVELPARGDDITYQLSDFDADSWLNPTLVVRSLPINYEIQPIPDPPEQEVKEVQNDGGLLPYGQIFAQLPHVPLSVTLPSNRKTIMKPVKK